MQNLALRWRRRIAALALVVAGVVCCVWGFPALRAFLETDRCLDSGGAIGPDGHCAHERP